LIGPASRKERGTLRELLVAYSELSAFDRRRTSILLDEPILTPPALARLDSRRTRLNIFDGEGEALLQYL
jgi:hypothetical protein